MEMREYNKSRVGETFNEGNLVVVSRAKGGYVKVKCLVCAKDPELYGDAVFEQVYTALRKGSIPCGCAKNPRISLMQYKIKIDRKIVSENLPIKFLGFGVISGKPSNTEVNLFCNRMGIEFTINSINSFFAGDGNLGIPHSASETLSKYNMNNPSYTVWDTGKKFGSSVWCGFHCKICESKGLESLFESTLNNLDKGRIPCYCSAKKKLSGDYISEMAKRRVSEGNNENISVIGAVKKGNYWFPTFVCKIHGLYSRVHDSTSAIGYECIECNPPKTGYDKSKQGSLYLLEIQTDSTIVLGYGITNKLNNRLTTHRKNLKDLGYKILSTRIFEGSGTKILSVENAIKLLHKTGLIDCEGFRRESISIDRKEEVLELCVGLKEISLDIPPNL